MKSLRERLVSLEQLGFLEREEFDERPPHVEYRLTPRGQKLSDLMKYIKTVADELDGNVCNCSAESCDCAAKQCDCSLSCPLRKPEKHEIAR